MNCCVKSVCGLMLYVAAVVGCAQSSAEQAETSAAVQNTEYLLSAEPEGALDVLDVREKAQDGQPVAVLGRIGGGINPWIEGRAAFLLIDERIQASCKEGEKCEAGCPDCAKEMLAASTMVKFVDDQGKVLNTDVRKLLGVKESQTVVIRGIANVDKSGSVSIAANGIFIRR